MEFGNIKPDPEMLSICVDLHKCRNNYRKLKRRSASPEYIKKLKSARGCLLGAVKLGGKFIIPYVSGFHSQDINDIVTPDGYLINYFTRDYYGVERKILTYPDYVYNIDLYRDVLGRPLFLSGQPYSEEMTECTILVRMNERAARNYMLDLMNVFYEHKGLHDYFVFLLDRNIKILCNRTYDDNDLYETLAEQLNSQIYGAPRILWTMKKSDIVCEELNYFAFDIIIVYNDLRYFGRYIKRDGRGCEEVNSNVVFSTVYECIETFCRAMFGIEDDIDKIISERFVYMENLL
jgi:hypothetical protein